MTDEKNTFFKYTLVAMLTVAALCYICGTDTRQGADGVGAALNGVRVQQQETGRHIDSATERIDTAEKSVSTAIQNSDRITDGLTTVESQLADGSDIIADSARRIEYCLAVVRKAKEQGSNN